MLYLLYENLQKENEMLKKKAIAVFAGSILMAGGAAYADTGDFVAGAVIGAVGSAIVTHAIDNSHHRRLNRRHRRLHRARHHIVHRVHKSHKSHKHNYAPVAVSPEVKIQKALTSLGFYHGKIDGQVNSYETRSAIKAMNQAYEIADNAYLDPRVKDSLVYLADLFSMDRMLITNANDKRSKGRQTQTALKVLGFYHGKIDGAVGPATRAAIAQYKAANQLGYGDRLTFEEAYRLIDTAKKRNDKNIDDTIASIKHIKTDKSANRANANNSAIVLQPLTKSNQ